MKKSDNNKNPKTKYYHEKYTRQRQAYPGLESKMRPLPDCGEESYTGADRLAGRRALITGGDSGIGRAVAIAYAREGADVAISYLPAEESDARDTAEYIQAAGRRAPRTGWTGHHRNERRHAAIQQRHHKTLHRPVGSNICSKCILNVLDGARRDSVAAPGRIHYNNFIHPGVPTRQRPAGLCRDQGRDCRIHARAGETGRAPRHTREFGGAGPHLDRPPDFWRPRPGNNPGIRHGYTIGPRRPAGRTCRRVRTAGIGRVIIHHSRSLRRHRRKSHNVKRNNNFLQI